jgi:hypothetical protein
MESTYSSETLVDFQRTTRSYILEDKTVYKHSCENLKSCLFCYLQIDLTLNMSQEHHLKNFILLVTTMQRHPHLQSHRHTAGAT